jgi:hypothetical protein
MTEQHTADPGVIRASNDDRDLAVADLYDACQRGRLTAAEYEVRTEAARRAPTIGHLWALTSDIPRVVPPTAVTVTPISPWSAPGMYGAPSWTAPAMASAVHRPRIHPLAVVAFAVSLFGLFTSALIYGSAVALLLAVVALVQVHDTEDDRGHGLATAALAISATSLLLAVDLLLRAHG